VLLGRHQQAQTWLWQYFRLSLVWSQLGFCCSPFECYRARNLCLLSKCSFSGFQHYSVNILTCNFSNVSFLSFSLMLDQARHSRRSPSFQNLPGFGLFRPCSSEALQTCSLLIYCNNFKACCRSFWLSRFQADRCRGGGYGTMLA
jgi:hypothetical protein